MTLHLPTVLTFAGLLTAAVTAGVALLAWRERRSYLLHWSAALICTFGGMLLFGLRGAAPDLLTVVMANLLLLGNLLFTLSGYQRLFGRAVPWAWMTALALLQLLVYAWLTYGVAHYGARVLVFNSSLALLSAAAALLLWEQRARLGWATLALPLASHLLQVLLGLLRIVLTLTQPDSSPAHVLAIMLNSFAAMCLAFGFMALHAGHLLDELEQQAATDPLTGLSNRRGFERALALEWHRHQREAPPLSALMIDIDHFKQLNDRLGHAQGDAALRHLGQVLREQVRDYDLVARLGGEEFCVVLPGVGADEARATAERLRRADLGFDAGERFTLSIGVATATGFDSTPEGLLQRADAALYRAKQLGRDRVEAG